MKSCLSVVNIDSTRSQVNKTNNHAVNLKLLKTNITKWCTYFFTLIANQIANFIFLNILIRKKC